MHVRFIVLVPGPVHVPSLYKPESMDVHADHNLPSNLHFLHAVSVVFTVPQAVLHVVAKHV